MDDQNGNHNEQYCNNPCYFSQSLIHNITYSLVNFTTIVTKAYPPCQADPQERPAIAAVEFSCRTIFANSKNCPAGFDMRIHRQRITET